MSPEQNCWIEMQQWTIPLDAEINKAKTVSLNIRDFFSEQNVMFTLAAREFMPRLFRDIALHCPVEIKKGETRFQ